MESFFVHLISWGLSWYMLLPPAPRLPSPRVVKSRLRSHVELSRESVPLSALGVCGGTLAGKLARFLARAGPSVAGLAFIGATLFMAQ